MISRSTLVGALVVAELVVLGVAIEAVSAPSMRAWAFEPRWGGVRAAGFMSGRYAVTRRLDKTFQTGAAPRVVIDVDRADVTIAAGPSGVVHVTGTMAIAGRTRGVPPSLDALRTADGVRVSVESGLVRGRIDRRVQLVVPSDASIDIASAGDVAVSGLRGAVRARLDSSDVRIANHRGDVDVTTSSGDVDLLDVQGGAVTLRTDNGDVKMTASGADNLVVETSSGDVTAGSLRAVEGTVHTANGDVAIGFAPASDTAVTLHTDSGTVSGAGPADAASDATPSLRLGSGRGHFTITTASGDIAVRQGANV